VLSTLFQRGFVLARICEFEADLGWYYQACTSGEARNFIEPGQKIYRKTLLSSCE